MKIVKRPRTANHLFHAT